MNIKKTEQFLYFQNKAKHYDNIHKIKPVINSRSFSPSREISTNPEYHYHRVPHMKKYDIIQQNQALVKAIVQINSSPKAHIESHGYSRYNGFEKKFNDYFRENEKYKTIERENRRQKQLIENAKPSVGTIADWSTRYGETENRKRLIRKNAKDEKSKPLILMRSKDKFFTPEHYLKFKEREESIGNFSLSKEKKHELPRLTSNGQYDWQAIIKDKSGVFDV